MPACYAHYRFAAEMLEKMPKDARRTVNRFRRLYDVGAHGPDPFFFYNPLRHNRVGELGSKFHEQSGEEFFGRVCRNIRLSPSEAAMSYLYGVLTHYCLDSCCHPFINQWTQEGPANHTEIEGEFERYLLVKDGKIPPEEAEISRHIYLTPGEWEVMAGFYPGISEKQAGKAVKHMEFITRFLQIPEGSRRDAVKKTLDKASREYAGLMIPSHPNPGCMDKDEMLMEHWKEAEELFPAELENITAHLTGSAPLGDMFEATFG